MLVTDVSTTCEEVIFRVKKTDSEDEFRTGCRNLTSLSNIDNSPYQDFNNPDNHNIRQLESFINVFFGNLLLDSTSLSCLFNLTRGLLGSGLSQNCRIFSNCFLSHCHVVRINHSFSFSSSPSLSATGRRFDTSPSSRVFCRKPNQSTCLKPKLNGRN